MLGEKNITPCDTSPVPSANRNEGECESPDKPNDPQSATITASVDQSEKDKIINTTYIEQEVDATESEAMIAIKRLENLPRTQLCAGIIYVLNRFMIDYPPAIPIIRGNTKEPNVPLEKFVQHVVHKTKLPGVVYASALVLIRRMIQSTPNSHVCKDNVYRLFIISCIISSKILIDRPLPNIKWCDISFNCYSLYFLNLMEIEMLESLQYRVTVEPEDILSIIEFTENRPNDIPQGMPQDLSREIPQYIRQSIQQNITQNIPQITQQDLLDNSEQPNPINFCPGDHPPECEVQ